MSVKKLLDLTGKVALITGGSRGLGLQMAEGAPDTLGAAPFAGRGARLGNDQCNNIQGH